LEVIGRLSREGRLAGGTDATAHLGLRAQSLTQRAGREPSVWLLLGLLLLLLRVVLLRRVVVLLLLLQVVLLRRVMLLLRVVLLLLLLLLRVVVLRWCIVLWYQRRP